jgi:hypothetical protein
MRAKSTKPPGRPVALQGPVPLNAEIHALQMRAEAAMEDRSVLPAWSMGQRLDLFCFLHLWISHVSKYGNRTVDEALIRSGSYREFCGWRRGRLNLVDIVDGLAALPVVRCEGKPGKRCLVLDLREPARDGQEVQS